VCVCVCVRERGVKCVVSRERVRERESEKERREGGGEREGGTSRPVAFQLTVLLGVGLVGCTGISRTTATGDSTLCGADKCVSSDLRSECSFEYPAFAQTQAQAQTKAETETHAQAHAHKHTHTCTGKF
jgi:hypothetical protein